jgi:glycosyltransferase involved in cell wall biosynthesis
VTDRLSILHVIARLNVGGAALHVLQLAHEQSQRGHDVLVVAGTLAAGEKSMEYVADELGVAVRRLPALQRELSVRADTTAIRELRRLVRQRRPDVVHTHTAKAGATGRLAALLLRRPRPALVHTYHGHVLTGYFSPRRERVFRWIERVLSRPTGALVAVSEEVRDDLVRLGVASPEGIAVVPYGFDLPSWSPSDDEARARTRAELGLGDGTFAIGWAGRLAAIKRPLDLVRTLRGVVDAGVDAVLVVVGDGELRAATEEAARELGVADRTRFVGFQRRIRDWYVAVDAALLTSANEGTPVVAIEALAAERPVVATAVGGTPTVVTDGRSGLLAPVGDTAALAARLVELAGDPELRRRLGAAGAADVRARFATERMADELEAIYRRCLA